MHSSFTAEYTGGYNDLVYLRARYYAPAIGRFITKDTWEGKPVVPIPYNKWIYTNSNPTSYLGSFDLFCTSDSFP